MNAPEEDAVGKPSKCTPDEMSSAGHAPVSSVQREWLLFMSWPDEDKWRSVYLKRGEVALRNTPKECWVIIRGIVRDVTPICKEFEKKKCLLPLLAEAGKDITYWFDTRGEDVTKLPKFIQATGKTLKIFDIPTLRSTLHCTTKYLQSTFLTYVHPESKEELPYLPHGPVPQLCDEFRASPCWFRTPLVPWWKDRRLFIGRITKNERPIRIKNMLTRFEAKFTVCEEDTLGGKIAERYRPYNWALESYVWKYEGRPLDMSKTLTENGIEDLRPKLRLLNIEECLYIPCICLYYKDDFL